ncbi:MAG: hypothetical protein COZ75_13485 [Flavobacteriaceae bacterium CG_4_8_14_3_um_filter_34_10]|nr:hypothetical protein [Flavobacteriia bacterium]OIP51456.1 MAG: hypothetical protein AUK33_04255 [Flavobacteriaceae bacterium CG2_30_34_30]PIQ17501.1 MAG: hypothetical protein COW66_11445 [Flavobacteriaceae bacterium CG18_big_fil_WC_8_21_14_2_50_34_36]PIV50307.1 MAG: hypothetical protein COS19_04480 [Flavobacteriaceae bacterium CG02_land_8_20_14_3_00_34_13]PIX08157.1 MAG: hypothetical protein COZ75_13485 [Flavobacteriaceae bacterium CG_4_8_14_3_um_filter_34_10]PIZ08419.1 MAG: hypothetical pr
MEEHDYILFEEYVSQKLDENARIAFENRLLKDSAFKDSFALYKETSTFLKNKFANQTEREAFKKNLKKISQSNTNTLKTQKQKTIFFKPWKIAVAASILVVFGVFFSQWFSTPVYGDYANYPEISLTVRGNQNELITKAEQAFNQAKYEEAASYFDQLLTTDSTNLELKLYKAITLVELNKMEAADVLFNEVAASTSVYANQALWYGALSKLKQKNYTASIALLKKIPQDDEQYKQAQKLIKKLF